MSSGKRWIFTCLLATAVLLVADGCGGSNSGGGTQPLPPITYTTFDVPGAATTNGLGTVPLAINAAGDIAGTYSDTSDHGHGFVRTAAGVLTPFDDPNQLPGGSNPVVAGINASGTIVGAFLDQNNVAHGFLRSQGGGFTNFDVPNSAGTVATGINDAGTASGTFIDFGGTGHGFLRATDGTFTTFNAPVTSVLVYPLFFRINASGELSGLFRDASSATHGLLRDTNGTLTQFDATGAGGGANEGTNALPINASGAIVGSVSAGGTTHSFLRATDGTFTVFDPPGAGLPSRTLSPSMTVEQLSVSITPTPEAAATFATPTARSRC